MPGETDAPLNDKNLHWVHLLAGVVRTNQDYGLGPMVLLPDVSATALVAFEAVELQAPMIFTAPLLVRTDRFPEKDLPICFCRLRCNLTASSPQCNNDSGTGCGRCSYIQHACCNDLSLAGIS